MSAPQAQQPAPGGRVTVAAGRLWAGGAATACVAALVAGVGVLFFSYVFDVELVGTALLLPITDSLALNYAVTAFLLGLAATGLAHLLTLTTPRPRVFFAWIVGLVTVAAMVRAIRLRGRPGREDRHLRDQSRDRYLDRKPAALSTCPHRARYRPVVAEALNALEPWKDHPVPRRTAVRVSGPATRAEAVTCRAGMQREATVSVVAVGAT